MTPKYRPDIDGLRAVAVLSVLFYHAGFPFISGGYVGVDIFFVISGFLITSIIVREIENDRFSITTFYERRFRRILPALVVVVFVSLIVGVLLLHPDHLRALGKSAVATSVFSSNILFYLESGYFDSSSEFKPLLHTWSLAVEEQYYIFFPILLIIIAKLDAKKYTRWLIPLALLSFIVCVFGMRYDASASFYLIPARAWELFIGSILAIHVLPEIKGRYVRDLLSLTGFAMIVLSLLYYTSATAFPGFAAALPTVGTALIIYSGSSGKSFVGQMLSLKPVVFIGLISYSLYLWHWPVIVYTKYFLIVEPGIIEIMAMLLAIFLFSILSWHYVETPFRKKIIFSKKSGVFIFSSATSVFLLVLGALLVTNDGLPNRLAEDKNYEVAADDTEWDHWGGCENVSKRIEVNKKLCDIGDTGSKHAFIVWGDSHAKALASSIDQSARRNGVAGSIASRNACPPLLSIERENRRACHEFNQLILQYITERSDIKTVILVSRWAISANGTRYKRERGQPVKLIDLDHRSNAHATNMDLFEIGLRQTVDRLQELGKTVVIVNSVPEVGYDVPSANYVAALTGRDAGLMIAPTLNEYNERNGSITSLLMELRDEGSVRVIEPAKFLCKEDSCKIIEEGSPIYRDDDHLSTFGAKFISHIFDGEFNRI